MVIMILSYEPSISLHVQTQRMWLVVPDTDSRVTCSTWYGFSRDLIRILAWLVKNTAFYKRVTLKVGTRKWEMGNEKRGNEEMGRKHIAFYSANCWHFVTAVIKYCVTKLKSMSIQHLLRSSIPYNLHQRDTYTICNGIAYCIMVGKLALHFWQLVSFL